MTPDFIDHGRDAFVLTGSRDLRACCADRDDLFSRLRELRRG
jgi:hypothetical protein